MNRPPITCHVLDVSKGYPASSIPVSLTLLRPYGPSAPLTSVTNADGRVTSWTEPEGGPSLEEVFANALGGGAGRVEGSDPSGLKDGEMLWSLKFEAGQYFKDEGWWDDIEVRFKTDVGGKEGEGKSHWHVPLLLSPWSYTTYRGS
ncbi:MAG: hypothetical protein M1831_005621 [Alyxoria varia]|nr:MAG: hypothetical protein M1831_005621 [Alyxoria varia]